MKFCYLIPDLGISVDGQKGASSHIRGFVHALKNLGHEVMIVTTQPTDPHAADVPIHVIPSPSLVAGILPDLQPRTFRALRHLFYNSAIEGFLDKVIQDFKPDYIYERYSPFSFAGGISAQKHRIPHVLEVNAPLAEQGKKYRKQALQEAAEVLEVSAFTHSSLLITLTEELKEWLMGLGFSENKIAIRPCGVDPGLFNPEGPDFKEEFKGKIVLGFLGSLKPWHDIPLLAELFPYLAKDPRFHLLVVGDGPMREVVQKIADAYPGRVTLTGAIAQEHVPAYVRTMDIALSPYPDLDLFYFSPLKVYEYMAMGKAIIATGIGQIRSLISHGKNGFLVAPHDVQGWVKAIYQLVEEPTLQATFGKKVREEIVLNHTWQKRAEAFVSTLDQKFS